MNSNGYFGKNISSKMQKIELLRNSFINMDIYGSIFVVHVPCVCLCSCMFRWRLHEVSYFLRIYLKIWVLCIVKFLHEDCKIAFPFRIILFSFWLWVNVVGWNSCIGHRWTNWPVPSSLLQSLPVWDNQQLGPHQLQRLWDIIPHIMHKPANPCLN